MHCPKILKRLEKFDKLSCFYDTTWSKRDKYHVLGFDGEFVVDKRRCNCSYRRLSGVPCSHTILVLYYNKGKLKNYLDACSNVNTFMEIYRHNLNPTHDRDY